MAMLAALDGDRRGNDAHYLLALRAAEEAADVLQVVRIRTNRGSHFMEEGSYAEALQELDVAVRLAELTSFASFLALSLSNRGETKLRWGASTMHSPTSKHRDCATGRSTRTRRSRSPLVDRGDLQRARQPRAGASHP